MKNFPKECWRLLFFSDSQGTDVMGCISLRPTYEGTRIGRTYFEPQYLISRKAYIILTDQKIHFLGGEAVLRVFPHMQQDGDVAACAHIALWSVLRSFSSRFSMYPEVRLGKLVEMAQPNADMRISSHGLTASQIADVFSAQGFVSVIDVSSLRLVRADAAHLASKIRITGSNSIKNLSPEIEDAITQAEQYYSDHQIDSSVANIIFLMMSYLIV